MDALDACDMSAPRVRRGDLAMLPQLEVATLTSIAQALSDPARVQILWLLEQRDELCTCEFEELLALGQSRVSYHLKLLVEAGLLVREKRGTWSHYQLARRGLIDCLRALAPHLTAPIGTQTEEETLDGTATAHR
jgi:ArsR family transcriptional regulator